MSEPCKLTTIHMPYRLHEKLRFFAKEKELSVNRVIRNAIEEFLKREGLLLEK